MPTENWIPLRIKDRVFANTIKFKERYTLTYESFAFLNDKVKNLN